MTMLGCHNNRNLVDKDVASIFFLFMLDDGAGGGGGNQIIKGLFDHEG